MLNSISKGNILVIKNAVRKKKILKICKYIDQKKIKISNNTKMIEGVKNIYYIANPIYKKSSKKRYLVSNRSWYFFPWNKDFSGLSNLVQSIFNKVIEINGYNPKKIFNSTPIDKIIQRFHLMHYPIGSGYISKHIDPVTIVKVTAGLYITQFKKDYDHGGFYAIDKKNKKINIDQYIKSSDLVLFYSAMPHGVDIIEKKNKTKNKVLSPGRWFLNMTLVASHHVKNRITSTGI